MVKQSFDLQVWRDHHDTAKYHGQFVKEAMNELFKFGIQPKEPEFTTHLTARDGALLACGLYMDRCGMGIGAPLWEYNPKDKSTWLSDPSFKYRKRIIM